MEEYDKHGGRGGGGGFGGSGSGSSGGLRFADKNIEYGP